MVDFLHYVGLRAHWHEYNYAFLLILKEKKEIKENAKFAENMFVLLWFKTIQYIAVET